MKKGKKYHLRPNFNGSGIKNVVIASVFQFFILNLQTLKQYIMYKEKKFFGLLALLLMSCGSISLDGLQRGVYAVQIGRLGSTLIRL